ncbi:hypothetical protein PIB30_104437, partial [Stylosanthes scabra]|nr:hypothetical protein [Stylosanthes scabra]
KIDGSLAFVGFVSDGSKVDENKGFHMLVKSSRRKFFSYTSMSSTRKSLAHKPLKNSLISTRVYICLFGSSLKLVGTNDSMNK